jgi:hypothetical protein
MPWLWIRRSVEDIRQESCKFLACTIYNVAKANVAEPEQHHFGGVKDIRNATPTHVMMINVVR